jgi:HAD superfamily 5'-nucleotidase-like hydrolase
MLVHPEGVHPHRRIFCNRTLNLGSVRAIGYDLDYTLVHYNVRAWEGRAYEHIQRRLSEQGWPVDDLAFDPSLVMRGLVVDTERGNLLKVDRFGFVKAALHGPALLPWTTTRELYARTLVDLADPRYDFTNTLFSLSEACMYAQLVPRLEAGQLPARLGYPELYVQVRAALNWTHVEGELKGEILADPDAFVELDPEVPAALLDQKKAGKKLLLITNSDWHYARAMLDHTFDRFLPSGWTWRDLFDFTVVGARKPFFFSERAPMLRLASDEGLFEPLIGPPPAAGGIFFGGHASLLERALGVSGSEILYVGDHVYTDVNVSKKLSRWRTALVLRELERELRAIEAEAADHAVVAELMTEKTRLEHQAHAVRLELLRVREGYGPPPTAPADELSARLDALVREIRALDARLAPILADDGKGFSKVWGLLLRAGNDKSHLLRQIERHADIYTSRVSNFLGYTPYAYFRAPRGDTPHDQPIRG